MADKLDVKRLIADFEAGAELGLEGFDAILARLPSSDNFRERVLIGRHRVAMNLNAALKELLKTKDLLIAHDQEVIETQRELIRNQRSALMMHQQMQAAHEKIIELQKQSLADQAELLARYRNQK